LGAVAAVLAPPVSAAPGVEQPAAGETPPAAGATQKGGSTKTGGPPPAHLPDGIPFGIGDESPAMLTDPLFRWLGVRYARLMVPWDVTEHPAELSAVTTWLDEASEAGVQPLVSFDKSVAHPNLLPTLATYSQAVGAFMRRFPSVNQYQPWNEENQGNEPTHSNAARAAAYYHWLSGACRGCTVSAADLLDGPTMEAWLRHFLRYVHHARLWGLHTYFELTYGGNHDLSRLSHLARGRIWLTEAGTPMWRFVRSERRFRFNSLDGQAEASHRLLTMVAHNSRISRVYFYQWRTPTSVTASETQLSHHRRVTETWDSGLLNPNCTVRPAFTILARAFGRRPATAPHTRRSPNGEECWSASSSGESPHAAESPALGQTPTPGETPG
jgi:hypothetical protein